MGWLMVKKSALSLPVVSDRPLNRTECIDGHRPCPFVSCRMHLLLDISARGRLWKNWAFDEQSDESIADALRAMPHTCALDVADSGEEMSLLEVGKLMGLSPTAVLEDEERAKRRILKEQVMPEFPEHPEDPYVRYTLMGEDELADVAAILRAREKGKR